MQCNVVLIDMESTLHDVFLAGGPCQCVHSGQILECDLTVRNELERREMRLEDPPLHFEDLLKADFEKILYLTAI